MKKRILPFLLIFSFLLPSIPAWAEPVQETAVTAETITSTQTDEALSLSAETAVLMDARSGKVLYDKNADQKMYPASITKLMTLLLTLEKGSLSDSITFSHDAIYSIEPGSAHIAIMEGETLTLEQVVRAIILRSANEASNGAAEYVDGSLDAFAKHMTEKAKELGCKNTSFVNANGLHDENHYTSAYDMALIGKALLQNEAYRSIMSETYYEIPPTNKQVETRYLHGQHQMLNPNSLYYYKDAIGGKTGFTSEAMNTLVTYARRDNTELITVVMKCNGAEHYVDTAALFDYGFAHYETLKAFSASEHAKAVSVTETYKKKTTELAQITAIPAADIYVTVPKGTQASALTFQTDCPDTLEAPIKQGQQLGTLTISLGNEILETVPLQADRDVSVMTEEEHKAADQASLLGILKKIGKILGICIGAFCVLLCITRTIGYHRHKKRMRNRAHRRKHGTVKHRQHQTHYKPRRYK